MEDRDILDIKQKLTDIETAMQKQHDSLWNAIKVVDDQLGKLTESLTAAVKILGEKPTS